MGFLLFWPAWRWDLALLQILIVFYSFFSCYCGCQQHSDFSKGFHGRDIVRVSLLSSSDLHRIQKYNWEKWTQEYTKTEAGVGHSAPLACAAIESYHNKTMMASSPLLCQLLIILNSSIIPIFIYLRQHEWYSHFRKKLDLNMESRTVHRNPKCHLANVIENFVNLSFNPLGLLYLPVCNCAACFFIHVMFLRPQRNRAKQPGSRKFHFKAIESFFVPCSVNHSFIFAPA